jgi:hypothetical protein
MRKTTLELPDGLVAEAKHRAAADRCTLREVVEIALRNYLTAVNQAQDFQLRDVSVDGNGLRPEFRGRSFDNVLEAAYEGRGS